MSYSEREEMFIERLIERGWMPPPEAPAKPWFSSSSEAIRWLLKEAQQWHDGNPEVAAHLVECAYLWDRDRRAIRARE